MKNFRAIWKHEVRQINAIAHPLVEEQKVRLSWRILIPPLLIKDYIHYRNRLRVLRKNLIFTKQLAFDVAKNVFDGKERAWEKRRIEIKTQEILDKEKKGYYTDKIRRKQFNEIELLIDYYLELMNTDQSKYAKIVKATYPSKGNYLSFLNKLQKLEEEVIQAAITTMRKGTKKERREWFDKVRATTKKVRMAELDDIYSEQ
ncbi:MAG: NF038143 family protein [Desulfobacteraceae bacterium]